MRKISLSILVMLIFTACSNSSPVQPPPSGSTAEIVTITSKSTTSALITFNQEMAESAANKDNYEITNETSGGQIIKLSVVEAVLSQDAKQVTLTTLTQAQVSYSVKISNVTSKDNKILDTSKNNTFVGTAGTGSSADTDGDGLSDAQEQQGWTVTVKNGDDSVSENRVTSDPNLADTDEDGVSDSEEFAKSTDPRVADTDSDGVDDNRELNLYNTDANNRDTDRDGLSDGDELNKYKTSPLLDDTDADQFKDKFEVDTANRNPRIANVPEPLIEIDSLGLALKITLQETKENSTNELQSKTASVTFSEGTSETLSTSDSATDEWFAKAGVSIKKEVGFEGPVPNGSLSGEFNAEGGLSGSNTFTVDEASTKESQETYGDAITLGKSISKGATFSQEISEGYVSAQVTISNLGDVTFTIEKLQIIAFMQSPNNPTQFEHMATLDFKGTGLTQTFSTSVGPKSESKQFPFEEKNGSFPNVIEQMMRNPSSVVFKVAGYDLVDESGRKFAYVQQELNDNTAKFFIDYGIERPFERNRVATFDAEQNSGGITIAETLEESLGLKWYDENVTPTSSLSKTEIENSYSTRLIDGTDTLWRVKNVARDKLVAPLKEWVVITQSGIDKSIDVRDFVLRPGIDATLSFAQDKDKDGVIARIEAQRGSSDEKIDSDGDGLSDREEIYEGWTIQVTKNSGSAATPIDIQVFSDPSRKDSDRDGLTDKEEKALRTDPANPDTDGDRIFDKTEVEGGYNVTLIDKTVVKISKLRGLGYATNPNDADTDDDLVKDGDELDYKVNPQVSDADLFTDTDNDGLSDRQEKEGWLVTSCAKSIYDGVEGFCSTIRVFSDPSKPDSDGDGLNDLKEYETPSTNPNLADTDGDGYKDNDIRDPDPLDADTDDDTLTDFFEQEKGWDVTYENEQDKRKTLPKVKSNAKLADSDFDGLSDATEHELGTNPQKEDSDGDGVKDNLDRGSRDPLVEDYSVRIEYKSLYIPDSCDGAVAGDWTWRLRAVGPDDSFTIAEQSKLFTADDGKDITFSGGYFTRIVDYDEYFYLEGFVKEWDSGDADFQQYFGGRGNHSYTRGSSLKTKRNQTINGLFDSSKLGHKTGGADRESSCSTTIRYLTIIE